MFIRSATCLAMVAAALVATAAIGSTGEQASAGVYSADHGDRITGGYWSSSREYYYRADWTGFSPASAGGQRVRRVMISGYHPAEGYEAETAAEADARRLSR